MSFKIINEFFEGEKSYAWFILLILPPTLWWLSTQQALHQTGLIGDFSTRGKAISSVNEYAKTMNDFTGDPVISIYKKRNGNKEARLIVRTMNDEEVVNDAVFPFIFPAFTGLLFGGWCFIVALKFTKNIRKDLKQKVFRVVAWANIIAFVYFVGPSRFIEYLK